MTTCQPGFERWALLDGALIRLRACRTIDELAANAAALAAEGCAAEAAVVLVPGSDGWTVWSSTGGTDLAVLVSGRRCGSVGIAPEREVTGIIGTIRAAGRMFGVLRLHGAAPTDDESARIDCFADALGSMIALVRVWQRTDELHAVLSGLATRVTGFGAAGVELVDGVPLPGAPGAPAAEVPAHDALTDRQREVLSLMVEGLSNKAIAERLVVSVPTVKSHVRAILRVCGAVNRSDAMARLTRATDQAGRRFYDTSPP